MLITKTIEIDMGHRLHNHHGKCRNFHGHRYKFEVGVEGKVSDEDGMVIDYNILKEVMNRVIDKELDHGFMIYEKDSYINIFESILLKGDLKIIVVSFIPTAENIAKYVYNNMKRMLDDKNIILKYVKVWETPTSTAVYKGE